MLVRWVSLMHFRAPEAQEILVGKRVSDAWTNVKLAINWVRGCRFMTGLAVENIMDMEN